MSMGQWLANIFGTDKKEPGMTYITMAELKAKLTAIGIPAACQYVLDTRIATVSSREMEAKLALYRREWLDLGGYIAEDNDCDNASAIPLGRVAGLGFLSGTVDGRRHAIVAWVDRDTGKVCFGDVQEARQIYPKIEMLPTRRDLILFVGGMA